MCFRDQPVTIPQHTHTHSSRVPGTHYYDWLYTWVLGVQTQILTLSKQTFCQRSHLPSLTATYLSRRFGRVVTSRRQFFLFQQLWDWQSPHKGKYGHDQETWSIWGEKDEDGPHYWHIYKASLHKITASLGQLLRLWHQHSILRLGSSICCLEKMKWIYFPGIPFQSGPSDHNLGFVLSWGSISSSSRTKILWKGQPRLGFHHERSTQQAREGEKPFVLGRESKYQSCLLQLFKYNTMFHWM